MDAAHEAMNLRLGKRGAVVTSGKGPLHGNEQVALQQQGNLPRGECLSETRCDGERGYVGVTPPAVVMFACGGTSS